VCGLAARGHRLPTPPRVAILLLIIVTLDFVLDTLARVAPPLRSGAPAHEGLEREPSGITPTTIIITTTTTTMSTSGISTSRAPAHVPAAAATC
jgi:hypothetical protein